MKFLGDEKKRVKYRNVEYIRCDCCKKKIEKYDYYYDFTAWYDDYDYMSDTNYEICEKCLPFFLNREVKDLGVGDKVELELVQLRDEEVEVERFSSYLLAKEDNGELGGINPSIFENKEAFTEAFLSLYSKEIEPLIEKGICALVYTQVSDVEDETNGLLTYDRQILKANPERLKALMDSLAEEIK